MSKRKIPEKRKSEEQENQSEEPASKKLAPIFQPKSSIADGVWKNLKDDLMIFTMNGVVAREKILGFDLDGTLIKTRSGGHFAKNDDDWQLWANNVSKKIAEYFENDYKICIFTNQKGMQLGHVKPEGFKRKIQAICGKIGVPIQVFISMGPPEFRKPYIGMWTRLEKYENGGVTVKRDESLYVGDAAGRIPSSTRPKKDHSAADRLFALNLKLPFKTPEQFFLDQPKEEPYELKSFDPHEILDNPEIVQFDPADTVIPYPGTEVIVFVGYPGSGKSAVANQLKEKYGYGVVCRDELKTWEKVVAKAKEMLKAKKSVIVDCTNPDAASRQRYVKLAKELNVQCRCFVMNTSYEHAQHNNAFRLLIGTDKAHKGVNTMVMNVFRKNFTEPTVKEGFIEVVKVNFVPMFQEPSHRDIYEMRLTD
uniref:Bifunctional polynucleotide phosphatase/kinase n=1 Tax=Acrobeloides nanus TaxID=290746 RepID=A0A914DQ85_9BILA